MADSDQVLGLLTDREGARVDLAERPGLGQVIELVEVPKIGDRDRVEGPIVGDVGSSGAPSRHRPRVLGIKGTAAGCVRVEAELTVVEGAAGMARGPGAVDERRVAERAGDAHPRFTGVVDKLDKPRPAPLGVGPEPVLRGRGVALLSLHRPYEVLDGHLCAQGVVKEDAATELDPGPFCRRSYAIPELGPALTLRCGGAVAGERNHQRAHAGRPLWQSIPPLGGERVVGDPSLRVVVLAPCEGGEERLSSEDAIAEVALELRRRGGGELFLGELDIDGRRRGLRCPDRPCAGDEPGEGEEDGEMSPRLAWGTHRRP